jgi:lipopolysaccharide transport system ATP-binding protein
MQDVSKGEGRTVLFVSHNMVAVNNLCNQAIFLDKGLLIDISNSDIIIKEYLASRLNTPYNAINKISEDGFFKLISIQLKGVYSNNLAEIEKLHKICVLVEILEDIDQMLYHTNLFVKDGSNNILFVIQSSPEKTLKGIYEIIYEIPANIMNDITYTFDIMLIKNQSQIIIDEKDVFSLEAIETIHRKGRWLGKFPGIIRPYFFKTQTTLVNPNNESETAI